MRRGRRSGGAMTTIQKPWISTRLLSSPRQILSIARWVPIGDSTVLWTGLCEGLKRHIKPNMGHKYIYFAFFKKYTVVLREKMDLV
jgi:hypothetical protein